jgi:hypothetical protein
VRTATPKNARSLEDYADFFVLLRELGVENVAIGGCAVGAYAHLVGETTISADLDLLVSRTALSSGALTALPGDSRVVKWPQPRTVPVAVVEWRGLEVNLLTATRGLASAEKEALVAREFRLRSRPEVAVLVVDPFDLLANKLAIDRPKDRPHVEILRRFLDEEVVRAFEIESDPRARLAPANRLLAVLKTKTLPAPLAARLVTLARIAPDYRFLAHRLPARRIADALLARVPDVALAAEVNAILAKRRYPEAQG